jgi:hypothetical protein
MLANVRYYLGQVLAESGRLEEAEKTYAEAERCYAQLAPSSSPGYWEKLKPHDWFTRAKLWTWQGELLSVLGRDHEGRRLC